MEIVVPIICNGVGKLKEETCINMKLLYALIYVEQWNKQQYLENSRSITNRVTVFN